MKNRILSKQIMAAMLAASLTLSMTACGSSQTSSSDNQERKDAAAIVEENQADPETVDTETVDMEESNDTSESESANKTEYPLTITTYGSDGKELTTTYEKAPEKVLAVYQGSVETLLALGLEDHIAAAAGLDNEVPDNQKAAFSSIDYLDEFTPSLETVTMLEPDMIFSWGSIFSDKKLGDAAGWVEKGTNIYMNSNTHPKDGDAAYNKTLENEYIDILNIGKIFDVQDKAETIVNEMKDTITSVKNQTADIEEKPTVLILESGKEGFTNYSSTSLGGDMVTQLGGILANNEGSTLGKEDVIAANPDVIFVVYMPYSGDDPEQVKQEKLNVLLKDETYASLDAVKNGRIVPIMLSEMYASATRTQDGILTFAKGLYPDLTLE